MIEAPPDDSRAELIQGYFNPTAFSIPATGTLGNTPRNFLIGPGSKNVDLSLFRTFTVREGLNVQFRMEAFNAFNFVNLGNRDRTSVPRILVASTRRARRVMQVGFRVTF